MDKGDGMERKSCIEGLYWVGRGLDGNFNLVFVLSCKLFQVVSLTVLYLPPSHFFFLPRDRASAPVSGIRARRFASFSLTNGVQHQENMTYIQLQLHGGYPKCKNAENLLILRLSQPRHTCIKVEKLLSRIKPHITKIAPTLLHRWGNTLPVSHAHSFTFNRSFLSTHAFMHIESQVSPALSYLQISH